MRVLNDFVCPDGHITEFFVEYDVTTLRCGCGKDATKRLKAPMFKEQTTGRNVTGKALDRCERKRDRAIKQERKASQE